MSGILEGMLFISGDEGLSLDKIKDTLEIDDCKLDELINKLEHDYESSDRGIRLEKVGDTLKLITKIEYKDYYKKIVDISSDILTESSLETLAIIAYNQPIVRSQVDEIRGVDSSYHIRKLLLKNLIEEKGRSELPGRPILYGTTNTFLDHFGLHSIDELPIIDNDIEEEDETDLFATKYSEDKITS